MSTNIVSTKPSPMNNRFVFTTAVTLFLALLHITQESSLLLTKNIRSLFLTEEDTINALPAGRSEIQQLISTDVTDTIDATTNQLMNHSGSLEYGDNGNDKDSPSTRRVEDEEECIVVEDKILPTNVTQPPGTSIPREIHFFVQSRCLPRDIANNVYHWKSIPDHSVFFHDIDSIYEYLQQPRLDMPYIAKALRCVFEHEAILDLARLTWLYEHGGISVDIDHIPGPAFANGTQTVVHVDPHGFSHHFVVEDESSNPYPRFLASKPRHYATFGALLLSIALQYKQFQFNTDGKHNGYKDSRNSIYRGALDEYLGHDYNLSVTRKTKSKELDNQIIILHSNRLPEDVFVKVSSVSSESVENVKLSPLTHDMKQCIDLNDDSFQVDVDSLLNVTNTDPLVADTGECPNNLTYIANTYIPESVNPSHRKIPKIVHMTSKSKCFTKAFADNVELWRFEGHSFFLHDDNAVHRLIDSREWSEFPLLKEVVPCLVDGASLADFWRYLALWEYGGIYTDMDNSPGYNFQGGSIIQEDDDGFFEVERQAFPSQYFFALSPHHPLAYFSVSATIGRMLLLASNLSRKKLIPFITGPGALKSSMISHMGHDYPTEGKYVGVSNRTITMVGSPLKAKRGVYCFRGVIRSSEENLSDMNMTHYLNHKKTQNDKKYSCRHQIISNHFV